MRLAQAHRQHVAVRGVQDGVFREIDQDGQPVALAAAEHDQIGASLPRRPAGSRALVLPISTRSVARSAAPSARRVRCSLFARALDQIRLRFAPSASAIRPSARPARIRRRASATIDAFEYAARSRPAMATCSLSSDRSNSTKIFLIAGHALKYSRLHAQALRRMLEQLRSNGPPAGRIAPASSVSGRNCGSMPQDSMSCRVEQALQSVAQGLAPVGKRGRHQGAQHAVAADVEARLRGRAAGARWPTRPWAAAETRRARHRTALRPRRRRRA